MCDISAIMAAGQAPVRYVQASCKAGLIIGGDILDDVNNVSPMSLGTRGNDFLKAVREILSHRM